MKRILLIAFPVLMVALISGYAIFRAPHDSEGTPAFGDLHLVRLPDDIKAARAELGRARRTADGFKPRGRYIVINTHSNTIVLRNEKRTIFKALCSTGSGGELVDADTGRRWIFNTPRGVFKIQNKLADPWWRKPDWAFIEENEIAPKDERRRFDPEMLGEYAMGFGDGYFIHGTVYERLLGVNVTHGCVRVGTDDLRYLYEKTEIGTPVYIF